VVEIVSEESRRRDMETKLAEYERGGVREYWLIDYAGRWARFHVLGDDGRYHSTGPGPSGIWTEGVYSSTAIEGFWIDVGWLWQEPLPQVLAVLRKLALV
jgi:Uma2 family endonuclease